MEDEILAGSRTADLWADAEEAESRALLASLLGSRAAADAALEDESLLPLTLSVLHTDGQEPHAIARLREALASHRA